TVPSARRVAHRATGTGYLGLSAGNAARDVSVRVGAQTGADRSAPGGRPRRTDARQPLLPEERGQTGLCVLSRSARAADSRRTGGVLSRPLSDMPRGFRPDAGLQLDA